MTVERYFKTALPLTLAGIAFAGYMTGVKLFSGACAFNESCPTLWGLPSCAYGLVIFILMFLVTLVALKRKKIDLRPIKQNLFLSGLGILFSGYFAVPEIITLVSGRGPGYMLGLPTCAYGLVFYIVIFIVTLVAVMKNRR
ncbi:hypothetical protein KKF05_03590 [Patescibacteria group bacterium]|nr:hypothetical protein [Patescibacteria group bacterium]MBU1916378.1 hypothetical protein [Patescibacteria group bacterium]